MNKEEIYYSLFGWRDDGEHTIAIFHVNLTEEDKDNKLQNSLHHKINYHTMIEHKEKVVLYKPERKVSIHYEFVKVEEDK